MSRAKDLKVLMELRPAMDGFAGIPQETRLLFAAFCKLSNAEVTGLLNHAVQHLAPGLEFEKKYDNRNIHEMYNVISRHIISHKENAHKSRFSKIASALTRRSRSLAFRLSNKMGRQQKIYRFETKNFEDFLWRRLFSKTLSVQDYQDVIAAKYAAIRPAWADMHRCGTSSLPYARYPRFQSSDFDVIIAQTPWPGRMSSSTQVVVRYHDAIPIFLPHTIPHTSFHQKSHYYALKENSKHSIFVCVSESTRHDLLSLFPALEERSLVIPNIVSHQYYREDAARAQLCEIICSCLWPGTEPVFQSSHEKSAFYQQHLDPAHMKYLIMVSTVEPRKNHRRAIGAWQLLRQRHGDNLKLILVGDLGWDNEETHSAMMAWQARGQLFHLARVPSRDLRLLLNGAEAVISPSLAEGFDLGGIEGMLCGTPVVASDIPVHREVFGDACRYFNPYSTRDCAGAIEVVIARENRDHRDLLVERGMKQAALYRRENIAPKWEDFFDRVRAGAYKQGSAGGKEGIESRPASNRHDSNGEARTGSQWAAE